MDKNKKKNENEEKLDEEIVEGQNEVIEEEHDENKALRDELKECQEKYRRALADYQNLEKRNVTDRAEWIKTANREMLLRILPIVDTLVLARKHDDNKTLEVALAQFMDILKAEGVTRIDTIGKNFDPVLMEAVEIAEEGDIIVDELRAGYMLYDKLLRPAQVKVGKK